MIYNEYTLQSTPFTFVTECNVKPAFSNAFKDAVLVCLTSPFTFRWDLLIRMTRVFSIIVAIPLLRWFGSTLKSMQPSGSTRSCPTGIESSKNNSIIASEAIILLNQLTWFSQRMGSVLWALVRTVGSLAQSKYSFASEVSAKRYVINTNI
jgi:hypothetical protein